MDNSQQFPLSLLVLSVTLLATVTTPAGLTASHLRHLSPMATAAGASVHVSIGKARLG